MPHTHTQRGFATRNSLRLPSWLEPAHHQCTWAWQAARQPCSHIATAAALITAAAAWQIITIERDADRTERQRQRERQRGGRRRRRQRTKVNDFIVARRRLLLPLACCYPLPPAYCSSSSLPLLCILTLCMCIKSAGSWK